MEHQLEEIPGPTEENREVRKELFTEIGKLRYSVWKDENSINDAQFPDGIWIDDSDEGGYHWIIRMQGQIVASARLTFHTSLEENHRDVQLWKRCGKHLPLPTVDLGRLVVLKDYRGYGYAKLLNQIRIDKAKALGAKSILVTASAGNKFILCRDFGFEDIGETIYFDDRPGTLFYALQLNLE